METKSIDVLLVDDNEGIRSTVEYFLRGFGCQVVSASNGKEAMKLFHTHGANFDVLLTDHSMPEMTGLELVQYLRKNCFPGRIIVMSGSLNEEAEAAYRTKRIDLILHKPFCGETLATLRNFILQSQEETSAVGM